MEYSVGTEQANKIKDRRVARFIAVTAFLLLLAVLYFIGYRISKPKLPGALAQEETQFIPIDAQILEQLAGNGGAGSPADVKKAIATPAQMQDILHTSGSSVHVKSGNSAITNTSTPTENASAAKYTGNNPFGTGGINGENYRNTIGNDQSEHIPSGEHMKRYLVEKPNTGNLQSDENCTIVLSVLVDPNGAIIGTPAFIKNNSTTNDITLINQVISIVKNQSQFNKVNTTKHTKESISIRITAN